MKINLSKINTLDDAAQAVLDNMKSNEQKEFAKMPYAHLISLHSGMGRQIRNEFKLWENFGKEFAKKVYLNENKHPDEISMDIIHKAWNKLQN